MEIFVGNVIARRSLLAEFVYVKVKGWSFHRVSHFIQRDDQNNSAEFPLIQGNVRMGHDVIAKEC